MPSSPRPGVVARIVPALIAVYATGHLLAVLVSVVPYPTQGLAKVKKVRDAREEVDRVLHTVHDAAGRPGSFRDFKRRTFSLVEGYTAGVKTARHFVGKYLSIIGSSQRWNMFGGIPPRHPIIARLEVSECGWAKDYFAVWLDGHAGAPGDRVFDTRERKAQESLYLRSKKMKQAYARHWMKRWETEHPGRHLHAIRFGYIETTTPPAASVGRFRERDKPRGSVTVTADKRCRR
jgi:hypothetical protein